MKGFLERMYVSFDILESERAFKFAASLKINTENKVA